MVRYLLAAVAAFSLASPLAAQAQDMPSYAQEQGQSSASADENIHGRVVDFDGGYNLTVSDDRGFTDMVELHPGTIINPTGLELAPGMVVSILGYNAGSYFAANEIDTPYTLENDVAWYDGEPWYYYGPAFSLDFFFGNRGWWHRPFAGGDHWGGGVHVYPAVPYRAGYPASGFHGYVAPAHEFSPPQTNRGAYTFGGYRSGTVGSDYHGGFTNSYHSGNAGGGYHAGNAGGGYHGGNAGGSFHGGGHER
ncbi:MAG TPA: hypothetical protein VME66_13805 [Candidatus Acidoferrales bacterium]|nr:hypothetical protein [Candidatus Acidoferrales bacterium]